MSILLGLKYATRAVQEIMEMKMSEHLRQTLENSLAELVTIEKLRKKMYLSHPLIINRESARSAILKFANKTAEMKNGQYDSSNLRAILDNCKLFSGWKKQKTDDLDGWLQTFQPVSTNQFIGHNNAQRIRNGKIRKLLQEIRIVNLNRDKS